MAVEFLPGNRLTLLRSGVEYFPALEAAIREARREIFLETYIYASDATGERITKALCEAARRAVPQPGRHGGSQPAARVVRDNLRHRRDIEEAYLAAIGSAQEEIIIASAYFFPGRRFRRALTGAAARSVRVVLLLQGRVEYVLLHYASHALYGRLLEAGGEIYEHQKSLMHAKVAGVDRHPGTAGSSHIHPVTPLPRPQ